MTLISESIICGEYTEEIITPVAKFCAGAIGPATKKLLVTCENRFS
ncbi:hypothetical protein MKZ26_00330 [Sporosarcina sp. FSL K6-6792]